MRGTHTILVLLTGRYHHSHFTDRDTGPQGICPASQHSQDSTSGLRAHLDFPINSQNWANSGGGENRGGGEGLSQDGLRARKVSAEKQASGWCLELL